MAYNKIFNGSHIFLICIYFVFGINLVNADTGSYQTNPSDTTLFYGRLWVQYDNSDASTSNNKDVQSIRDNEGMGRLGIKGKSSVGNGYLVNYKVEYAIDIGDGTSSSDSSTSCSGARDCRTFSLKQGWLGFKTPFGQFKVGSMESPYKYMAKHDILHDTISQARDTRMISQGSMSHSSYWRESILYEFKSGDLKFAVIYGVGEKYNTITHKDTGIGIEYKNLFISGLDIVYARNKDNSVTGVGNQNYNEKFTLTKNFKLEGKRKLKVWYMHEDIGLDSKLFTGGNSDGEIDWYGIQYMCGPITLQFSYSDSDASEGPTYDRDGYNIGIQYKISKSSSVYIGNSSSEAGSGDGINSDISSTMIGLRHDF
ncbi:MAG: porin [Gammaproteobacteria bacterium]|jgi:predicted porin|nr:porin [Gammaproteobacteria bacterium]MBT4462884.1 porin [Gammaproteobacteria bacterium]MBT4655390.1 porin [Gammaproteobacteria bacterium]MBT5116320.1 porin [Gammaproteobacteria bacterium]MBT5761379.1 porin [Gammaproteobacteria bacterium]